MADLWLSQFCWLRHLLCFKTLSHATVLEFERRLRRLPQPRQTLEASHESTDFSSSQSMQYLYDLVGVLYPANYFVLVNILLLECWRPSLDCRVLEVWHQKMWIWSQQKRRLSKHIKIQNAGSRCFCWFLQSCCYHWDSHCWETQCYLLYHNSQRRLISLVVLTFFLFCVRSKEGRIQGLKGGKESGKEERNKQKSKKDRKGKQELKREKRRD